MPENVQRIVDKRAVERDLSHDLNELFGMMRDFGAQLTDVAGTLTAHMRAEEVAARGYTDALKELTRRVDALGVVFKAFPNDEDGEPDIKGHKRYHSSLIIGSEKNGRFWHAVKEQVGRNLVTGVMGLLLLGGNAYVLSIVREERDAYKSPVAVQKNVVDAAIKQRMESEQK